MIRTFPLFLSTSPDVQYVIASLAIFTPFDAPDELYEFVGYDGFGV